MAFLRRWLRVAVVGDEWTDRAVRLLSLGAAAAVAWFLQPVGITVTRDSSVLWSHQGLPLGTFLAVLAAVVWLSLTAGVAWVTSRGPRLRVDDHLTVDTQTANHVAYFRLRLWNDGGGVASPEVRVVKVVFESGRPAANEAQLPLTLPWSRLGGKPPQLIRSQRHGEAVGVLGVLSDDPHHPTAQVQLYVAGAHHHLLVGPYGSPNIGWRQGQKVYVQVEITLPDYEHVPPCYRWFSLQRDDGPAGFRVATEEPRRPYRDRLLATLSHT